MNREIKFRAWDKKSKKMIYPTGYYGSDLHWRIEGSNNGFWGMFDGNKRLCGNADESGVLLQYTGFKDKDNKEIYEGDIVRLYTPYYNENNKVKLEYKAFYFEEGAFFQLENIKDKNDLDTFCGYSNKQFEVIGNIYENPELLEGEE